MSALILILATWLLYGVAVLYLGPRWKKLRYAPIVIGGLIAFAPVWSLLVMFLAGLIGCSVNAAGPHACYLPLVGDIGELLYLVGNMAAWGFFILPVLMLVGAIYIVLHLPFFVVAKRREKSANPPQPRPRLVAIVALIAVAVVMLDQFYSARSAQARRKTARYVGTIESMCPLHIKYGTDYAQAPGSTLKPEDAASSALAAGYLDCDFARDQVILGDLKNYYITKSGSAGEIIVDGENGAVSRQDDKHDYVMPVPESRY